MLRLATLCGSYLFLIGPPRLRMRGASDIDNFIYTHLIPDVPPFMGGIFPRPSGARDYSINGQYIIKSTGC